MFEFLKKLFKRKSAETVTAQYHPAVAKTIELLTESKGWRFVWSTGHCDCYEISPDKRSYGTLTVYICDYKASYAEWNRSVLTGVPQWAFKQFSREIGNRLMEAHFKDLK